MIKQLSQIYIAKYGDDINSISSSYGISPLKILLYNNVLPQDIKDGTILFVKI